MLENNIPWIPACFILAVLIAGCISNAAVLKNVYEPKYAFDKGDHLAYEVTSAQESRNNAVTKALEMDVTSSDGRLIEMLVSPKNVPAGQSADPPFTMTITPYGEIVRTDYLGPVEREIQPEFPNGMKYPEKAVFLQKVWAGKIEKSGNYSTTDGVVDFSVSGDTRYTSIDPKIVSVKAGRYPCLGIKQEVNFTLSEKIDTANGTIYTTTTGKINGENWIDQNKGFLVKSDYRIQKVISADISEVTKRMGFEEFHRDIPSNSTVSCELTEMKTIKM